MTPERNELVLKSFILDFSLDAFEQRIAVTENQGLGESDRHADVGHRMVPIASNCLARSKRDWMRNWCGHSKQRLELPPTLQSQRICSLDSICSKPSLVGAPKSHVFS